MATRVTGDFGAARLERNLGDAQKMLDVQVLKDTEPYVPADTMNLARSAQRATRVGSGQVVWEGPYAARQYYTAPNKARDVHPLAVMRWFEAAKATMRPKWLRIAKAAGGKR